MFLNRIVSGNKEELIHQVYTQQKKFKFPKCWTAEIAAIKKLYQLDIEEDQIRALSKLSWINHSGQKDPIKTTKTTKHRESEKKQSM